MSAPLSEFPFYTTRFGGVMADQEALEVVSGLKIHPKVFELEPLGHRMHIILDEIPDEVGGIVLPENIRDKEREGAGWVVACGGLCATAASANLGSRSMQTIGPENLLYKHVYFGEMIGKSIKLMFTADEWALVRRDIDQYAKVLVLTDGDLWGIDHQKVIKS